MGAIPGRKGEILAGVVLANKGAVPAFSRSWGTSVLCIPPSVPGGQRLQSGTITKNAGSSDIRVPRTRGMLSPSGNSSMPGRTLLGRSPLTLRLPGGTATLTGQRPGDGEARPTKGSELPGEGKQSNTAASPVLALGPGVGGHGQGPPPGAAPHFGEGSRSSRNLMVPKHRASWYARQHVVSPGSGLGFTY